MFLTLLIDSLARYDVQELHFAFNRLQSATLLSNMLTSAVKDDAICFIAKFHNSVQQVDLMFKVERHYFIRHHNNLCWQLHEYVHVLTTTVYCSDLALPHMPFTLSLDLTEMY